MKLSVRQEPCFVLTLTGKEATSLLKALKVSLQVLEGNALEDPHELAALALCKMLAPTLAKQGVMDTHPEIEKEYTRASKPEGAAPKVPRTPKPVPKTAPEEDSLEGLIASSQDVSEGA